MITESKLTLGYFKELGLFEELKCTPVFQFTCFGSPKSYKTESVNKKEIQIPIRYSIGY